MIDQQYFEFADVRRFAGSTWIPLRENSPVTYDPSGDAVSLRGYTGIATAAINRDKREAGDRVGWDDLCASAHRSVYDNDDIYYPADLFRSWRDGIIGINLIIDQHVEGTGDHVWHLHPDLVVALRLVREEDQWFRPDEGWAEVVRLRRDPAGTPYAVEMRLEYLKDYLAARRMDLLISSYRDRVAITEDRPDYDWPENEPTTEKDRDRLELLIRPARYPAASGHFQASGALWRTEWIDGGDASPRVRGDADDDSTTFVVDAEGTRLPARAIGGGIDWLCFRPAIVASLLRHKGAALGWLSAETGSVGATAFGVQFGINELGLINVFAKDIAHLDAWEQRLWSAENVAPDGDVSAELFAAQMEVMPAETVAPEAELGDAIAGIDGAFEVRYGGPLLRPNERLAGIAGRIHRFAAAQDEGLLLVSKELTRLFAESIDVDAVDRAVRLPRDKDGRLPASLKAIEYMVGQFIPEDDARTMMGPLFGIRDLRIADAHLGREKIASGLERAKVDTTRPAVEQGRQLLAAFVDTLKAIAGVLA